jgi:hypothetical protein
MARYLTEVGTEIRECRYEAAMEMIVLLLRKHNGNIVHAANDLNVHHATFKRWVVALDNAGQPIRQTIAEIRRVGAKKQARQKVKRKSVNGHRERVKRLDSAELRNSRSPLRN